MGSHSPIKEVEEAWNKFQLVEEDKGGIKVTAEDTQKGDGENTNLKRFLTDTDNTLNFISMNITFASIWEPRKGIVVKELGGSR